MKSFLICLNFFVVGIAVNTTNIFISGPLYLTAIILLFFGLNKFCTRKSLKFRLAFPCYHIMFLFHSLEYNSVLGRGQGLALALIFNVLIFYFLIAGAIKYMRADAPKTLI